MKKLFINSFALFLIKVLTASSLVFAKTTGSAAGVASADNEFILVHGVVKQKNQHLYLVSKDRIYKLNKLSFLKANSLSSESALTQGQYRIKGKDILETKKNNNKGLSR